MSAGQRLTVLVVGLALAAIIVVGLNVSGWGTASQPSASPIPSVSASSSALGIASQSAAPSAPDDAETLATLRAIEEQVVAIRGLPAADIGPPDVITRAELVEELRRIFEAEYPADERARDNAALRALGLLEPDQDIAGLQLELLGRQVLGFYDDLDQRMVVVSEAGLDAKAKLTYAHEYTHALQDAAFGLDSLQTDAAGEDDRGLARTALIEGDANITMLAWAFANLTPQELIEVGSGAQLPDTQGFPTWMVDQLQFPYTDGMNWASVVAGDPIDPDYDALDTAFADPPDSTEQILHTSKWEPREVPVPVAAVDLAGALGEGWEEVDATPIGEETIRIMLSFHGLDRDVASAAAAGWGGDRAVIATGPGDAFAVAWRLRWDTAGDVSEFVDAYRRVTGLLPFPAIVAQLSDGSVLVVHASSQDVLGRAADAADN